MRQFVSLLVQRLRMHVGELVMAYALVESVLRNFPTTMRVNSVRPMLLGACFIACKTSRDEDLELSQVPSPPPRPPQPPRPNPQAARANFAFAEGSLPRPRQCHESLCDVLCVDLALLSRVEHQMLELLHWCVPMGSVYQTYANAIFDSASRHLGRTVAAPNVLLALEESAEDATHAVTASAAVQGCAREQCAALSQCSREGGIPPSPGPTTTTQHDLS